MAEKLAAACRTQRMIYNGIAGAADSSASKQVKLTNNARQRRRKQS